MMMGSENYRFLNSGGPLGIAPHCRNDLVTNEVHKEFQVKKQILHSIAFRSE